EVQQSLVVHDQSNPRLIARSFETAEFHIRLRKDAFECPRIEMLKQPGCSGSFESSGTPAGATAKTDAGRDNLCRGLAAEFVERENLQTLDACYRHEPDRGTPNS